MKHYSAAIVLVCLLVAPMRADSSSTSMPSFWRYSHPEAKALIGIEWGRMVNTPLGQEMRRKMAEQGVGGSKELELIESIGRILISSPGNQGGSDGGKAPGVIAAQGEFDLDRIRELVGGEAVETTEYESVEMLNQLGKDGRPMSIALVNPQLVLMGDRLSVEAAIDHYLAGDPAQAVNPLYQRASVLAGESDVWVVANASPADFSSGGSQQAELLKDVEAIEAGLSIQSGLGLQLNLDTKSDQSATELAAGLQLITGMMLASVQREPGALDLSQHVVINADHSQVKLALSLDEEEVRQGVAQFETAFHPMSAEPGAEVETTGKVRGDGEWSWAEQPQPKEPRKQVITIWGLEDGPREIPVQP